MKTVVAVITITLLAFATSAHGQAGSAAAKCAELKDPKKRLACFDVKVPELLKEFAESNAAKQAEASLAEAQAGQVKLIKSALRELRKLSTAAEVGISKGDYSRRLIDVTANVREELSQVEEGPIKENLGIALIRFQAAAEIWAATFETEYPYRFFQVYESHLMTYGVYRTTYSNSEQYTPFTRLDRSRVISPIWQAARESMAAAELLLKTMER